MLAAAWSLTAQDVDGRKGLSEQERSDRNAVIEKHDVDGDGVLSSSELKGLSKEEKKTLAKTGGVGTARKAASETHASKKSVEADAGSETRGKDRKPSDTGKPSKSPGQKQGKGGKK